MSTGTLRVRFLRAVLADLLKDSAPVLVALETLGAMALVLSRA